MSEAGDPLSLARSSGRSASWVWTQLIPPKGG
jgi:hypothetical protein